MSYEKFLHDHIENIEIANAEEVIFERELGRFMIAWSDAESELYRVLIAYSGVSDPVGRALFSGTRARAMIDFIRSIAHNTSMEADRCEDLEHVFKQMASINSMRDHLAHHTTASYSYSDPTRRVVANVRSSRYGNGKGYEIGADTLASMTWDLYGIANHLNMHWGTRNGPFRPWRENPEDDVPTPWTYKPPQPIGTWESIPSAPQEYPSQHKSSQN